MAGGEGTVMASIHCLKHVQSLCAADLAYNYPVWTHTQSRSNQVPNGDCTAAVRTSVASFQPYQVVERPNLKLRRVLDGDDPLISWDKIR